MSAEPKDRDGAQNQHYVPKFILRNFLSNEEKEQVSVFRKSSGTGFLTSIRNIMAERRFHEFVISDDYLASFEDSIGRIEDHLLPTYRRIVEHRRLENSPEERAHLAFFVTFQFVRTRQQREQFVQMEEQISDHLQKMGGNIEQLEGYEPLTEERLKAQHIKFIRESIPEFAPHVAAKDFLLLSAPEGRSFYLGDNPVSLHNSQPAHPFWGNIGLAVSGIEIYLPLSANLMLAAWCPSILSKARGERARQKQIFSAQLLGMVMNGAITNEQMRQQLAQLEELGRPVDEMLAHADAGTPFPLDDSNMDFSNSLQMNFARDYVICQRGDFKLAHRFVKDFPDQRGKRIVAM